MGVYYLLALARIVHRQPSPSWAQGQGVYQEMPLSYRGGVQHLWSCGVLPASACAAAEGRAAYSAPWQGLSCSVCEDAAKLTIIYNIVAQRSVNEVMRRRGSAVHQSVECSARGAPSSWRATCLTISTSTRIIIIIITHGLLTVHMRMYIVRIRMYIHTHPRGHQAHLLQ